MLRITIDNMDGRGAVDYSQAIVAEGRIRVTRTLNAPSKCSFALEPVSAGLGIPVRKGRVVVTTESGQTLFTGYLATEPFAVYAGAGVIGDVYCYRVSAVSDEWLLDKQGSGASAASNGLQLQTSAGALLRQLTTGVQNSAGDAAPELAFASGDNPRAVGAFAVAPAASWSTNAAAAANATYSAYRVVEGQISTAAAGAVVHAVLSGDGSFAPATFSTSSLRELANDITVTGEIEPSTYVQEVFCGDGTTTEFVLSEPVFRGTGRTLLRDDFDEAVLDPTQWQVADGGNHLQLTGAGLTLNGGNGLDGQTTLTAQNSVEMGGSLLLQMEGVLFGQGSDGMLAGFYNGASVLQNCFAGFRVRQSSSNTGSETVLVPVVNGAECGTVFTPVAGHNYTLRLRMYCCEMQRIAQRYYCMVDGTIEDFGDSAGVSAPMHLVFEIVDAGAASNTPVSVLWDTAPSGPLEVTPALTSFVAVNATNLFGSIAAVSLTRPSSLWLISTLPNGQQSTRLMGTAGEGVDCEAALGSPGGTSAKVSFFAGRIPQSGERIAAFYRTAQRSVARLADAASIAAEAAAGQGSAVPGLSRWLGKVEAPKARSSADCESAALAVLAMATARSAAQRGTCVLNDPAQDVWPGDLLQVAQQSDVLQVLVRAVEIEDQHSVPESLEYRVTFANDWATEVEDGLGLKLSNGPAADAVLPAEASAAAEAGPGTLQQIAIVSLGSNALQVDMGEAPPAGGGFEVRRRPNNFGAKSSPGDLVLRSPVRSFSIPRAAQTERFFVRAYDASTPALYSRYASAVIVNWPLD